MKDFNKIVVLVLVLCLLTCMNTNVVEGFYEFAGYANYADYAESVKESWKLSVEAFLNQDYSLLFNLVFSKTES